MMICIDNKAGSDTVLAQHFCKSNVILAEGLPLCLGKDTLVGMINLSAGNCGRSFCGYICERMLRLMKQQR